MATRSMAKLSNAAWLFCCAVSLLMPSATGLNRCRVPCVRDVDRESCNSAICGSNRYTRERFAALCADSCRQATGPQSALTDCLADPSSGLTPQSQQRVLESVDFIISASCRFTRAISRPEEMESANDGGVEEQSIEMNGTKNLRDESAQDHDGGLEEEDKEISIPKKEMNKMAAEDLAESPLAMNENNAKVPMNMESMVAGEVTEGAAEKESAADFDKAPVVINVLIANSTAELESMANEDANKTNVMMEKVVDEGVGVVAARDTTNDDGEFRMNQDMKRILEEEAIRATDQLMREAMEEDMKKAVDASQESVAPNSGL